MKSQNILRFLIICIALAPLVACLQSNRNIGDQSGQTSPEPNSRTAPNSNTGSSSSSNQDDASDWDAVIRNGDIQKFDDLIKAGLKLRDNGVGIKAFRDAQNDEMKGKIANRLAEEFRQHDFDELPALLENAFQEGGYEDVIRFAVEKERKKVGDAAVLAEFVDATKLFPMLKSLNFDFDQTLPKAFGLSEEKDRGPMIVMMTALAGSGDRKLKIATALLDAGADVNAVDGHGHTVLHYVGLEADKGYKWAEDLADFLQSHGAIKK